MGILKIHIGNLIVTWTMDFILTLCCWLLFTQIVDAQIRMNFQEVKIPNATMDLYSAVEDDDGFIWIGKFDGLYRYDGLSFTRFSSIPQDTTSITHGRPLYVAKGNEQDLWIGSNTGGVSRLDLQTHRFTSFRHGLDNEKSLGGNNIGGIAVDNEGSVWIGSDDLCLNRLDWKTGTAQRYYPDTWNGPQIAGDYLGQVVLDPTNNQWLWLGSPHGVYQFDKSTGKFTLYAFSTMYSEYKPIPVPVFVDNEGIVWAGSTGGIVRIEPQSGNIDEVVLGLANYPLSHGAWVATAISDYNAEQLAIMTHHDGLIVYQKDGSGYERINNDPMLGHGSNFYLKDKLGNTWIEAGALLRHTPRQHFAKTLSLRHLPGTNWIRSFLHGRSDSELYIGTLRGAGLVHADFATGSVQAYGYAFNAERNGDVFIRDLAWHSDSTIYCASSTGLLQFDPENPRLQGIASPDTTYSWSNVLSVCSCDGALWVASEGEGLFAFEDSRLTQVLTQEAFIKNAVNALACHDGEIWIGTAYGLLKLASEADRAPIMVIPDIPVSRMMKADQMLWVATLGQGLFSVELDSDQQIKQHYTKEGGPSNLIYNLTGTNDSLWINTDGGAIQYYPASGTYRHHPDLGVGGRSPIIQLSNGLMVTGAYRGLAYFKPEETKISSTPPKVYLTNINIANREESFEFAPDKIEHVTLRPNERELTIEFGAINFNDNSSTTFEYRLSNVSEDWRSLGSTKFLNINRLAPGDYTLEIKSINAYGGENVRNKELQITVVPPIFLRWWFQLLAATALMMTGFTAFRIMQARRLKILHDQTVEYFANSRYAQNSVDEILWDVARNVVSRLDFQDCVIYTLDSEKSVLIQQAAYGLKNPQGREIANPVTISIGSGIVGTAAAKKTAILVADVSSDPRYIVDIEPQGSELAVPIIHQDRVIGVIDSEHAKKGFFRKSHFDVLIRIATECAHKIASAQAAEQIVLHERQLLEVEKEVAELKLTALQAQMNPHFIFNSLNSINWYILINKPAEASLYLSKFSKLVRLILDNSKSLSIPLDKELEALKLYIDLEAMRFVNTFDYEIQMDDEVDAEEVRIPPLILQPFVENAIWHGLMHRKEKGKLTIQIIADENRLKCIVQDDGIGRRASARRKSEQPSGHESRGLKLTTDRIQLLHRDYLKQDMIRIIDLEDAKGEATGTRVEVVLPYD